MIRAVVFCLSLLWVNGLEASLDQGILLINQGEFEQAIPALLRAVEQKKDLAPTYLYLGMAYLQTGEFEKARKSLEKSNSLEPNSPAVHYHLAILHESKRMKSKAIYHWKKVSQLSEIPSLKELAQKHIKQLEIP